MFPCPSAPTGKGLLQRDQPCRRAASAELDAQYYYNATPGSAQRDIKAALRVMPALRELAAQHPGMTPTEFAAAYRAALRKVQTSLGAPGLAPAASNATFDAELNLKPLLQARWG